MHRAPALIALIAYGLNLGCSSWKEVPVAEARPSEKVEAVVYRSGDVVKFDEHSGIVNMYRGTIDGTSLRRPVSIPLDHVITLRVQRTDVTKTVLWTVVGIGLVAVVVAVLNNNPIISGGGGLEGL